VRDIIVLADKITLSEPRRRMPHPLPVPDLLRKSPLPHFVGARREAETERGYSRQPRGKISRLLPAKPLISLDRGNFLCRSSPRPRVLADNPWSSLLAGTGVRNRPSRQVWRRREPRAVGGHLRPGPDPRARVPSKDRRAMGRERRG
jgi:hypothetical protein